VGRQFAANGTMHGVTSFPPGFRRDDAADDAGFYADDTFAQCER